MVSEGQQSKYHGRCGSMMNLTKIVGDNIPLQDLEGSFAGSVKIGKSKYDNHGLNLGLAKPADRSMTN